MTTTIERASMLVFALCVACGGSTAGEGSGGSSGTGGAGGSGGTGNTSGGGFVITCPGG